MLLALTHLCVAAGGWFTRDWLLFATGVSAGLALVAVVVWEATC
jgi:hypothetical protein